MKGLALVLIGIFLLNLLVAVWLVILALLDRYHQREAAREIEDLERSFALASEGSDVLATRRLGGGRRSTAVRDRIRSPHRAIVGRGSPGLPRLVSRAGVSLGLAALTLCVAIAVPDLGGRQGVTSADGPSSVVFPPAEEGPSHRGARPSSDAPDPREVALPRESRSQDVPSTTHPPSMVPYTTTDTDFEGRTVPGRVVANSRSATAITLVWATVRGATAYQVERRAEQPQDIWQSIATVEQGTTYIDTGLEADTTYYYRVAAEIEEVLALPSDVVSATTSIAPPTATSLTVNETGTTIELTWLDVADETGYRIERSLHGTGEWISIGTTGQDVTVYVDDALSPGVNYEYRIVTTNASGESAPSNVVSVKINGPASPSTGESPGSGNGSASIENTTTSPASEETPASEDTPATEETSTEESP